MSVYDEWTYTRGKRKGTRKPCWGKGRRWRVRYLDPQIGKYREEYFAIKDEAYDWDAKKRVENNEGTYVDAKAGKVTIAEYGTSWLKNKVVRDSSFQRLEIAWRLQIIPHIGHIQIGRARPSQIQGWVKKLIDSGLAPATIRLAYGTLANMFDAAVIDRAGLTVTPCREIDLPALPDNDYWLPTKAQVAQLIQVIDPRYRLAVYLAAGCGLRWGEMAGMTVGDIDFLRRTVKVRQRLDRPRNEPPCLALLKSAKSRRDLTLPASVGVVASAHIAAGYTFDTTIVDTTVRKKVNQPTPVRTTTMLFSRPDGDRLLRAQEWSAVWHAATAQVPGMPEDFTFHGLRHYFASLLIHGGANIKVVQQKMGHAKATTTLNTYGHLFPDTEDRTAGVVEDAFSEGERDLDAAQTG